MNRSYLTIVAIAVAVGCHQAVGGWDRYIDTPPDESELAGAWRPDESSLGRLAEVGYEHTQVGDHLIELNPDHTCAFRSYPHYRLGGAPFITDHACTWRLSTATAYVHHKRHDAPVAEIRLRRGSAIAVTSFYITREDGKIILWQFIGDPDYSVYMDFVSG